MKKSTYFAIIATLAMLIVLMTFIVFVKLSVRLDELDETIIETPDISSVDDGTYSGRYELFPLSVDIEVTIVNHQYMDIVITGESIFFNRDAEVIISTVLLNQNLDIEIDDTRAYSEKILLLAIIDAVENQAPVIDD